MVCAWQVRVTVETAAARNKPVNVGMWSLFKHKPWISLRWVRDTAPEGRSYALVRHYKPLMKHSEWHTSGSGEGWWKLRNDRREGRVFGVKNSMSLSKLKQTFCLLLKFSEV